MPWDTLWFYIQSQLPSIEVVATFAALAAIILLMPRIAGIRPSRWIMARDIGLVGVFAIVSLVLLQLEPQHHWLQHAGDWFNSLF